MARNGPIDEKGVQRALNYGVPRTEETKKKIGEGVKAAYRRRRELGHSR